MYPLCAPLTFASIGKTAAPVSVVNQLLQLLGVVLALYILKSLWPKVVFLRRWVHTPSDAAIMAPRIVTGSSRHPRYQSDSQPSVQVVPGMCRRSTMGDNIWRLCGLKNPLDNSSPDYVVDDRFYTDQTNFIIANSRTPSRIHLPTATSYVCATCDKLFNQFWSWDPICPHCERNACPRCKHSAWHSHTYVDGVSLLRPHRHTAILQDRRVQTDSFRRPLDTVVVAKSANFVSGTDIGGSWPYSYASQWLLAAKVKALAYYEDMAGACGKIDVGCSEYSRERHDELLSC
jgi:hypothetical protein